MSKIALTPKWPHNFDHSSNTEREYAYSWRQTPDDDEYYWVVHMINEYEHPVPLSDNDPDTLTCSTGRNAASEPETVRLYEETLCDEAAEHGWSAAELQHVRNYRNIHEVGHNFELQHVGDQTSVMWAASEGEEGLRATAPLHFSDEELDTIRGTDNP